jgi:riboflavin synthase
MFTGIVQGKGKVIEIERCQKGGTLILEIPSTIKLQKGESLGVNGVCLTVKEIKKNRVWFDCMPETFRVTNLGFLKPNEEVNLEKPITLQTPLGGHLVQGHVDGIGIIADVKIEGNARILRIKAPRHLCRYFIPKGSVAVDGVSLTIAKAFKDGFTVSLIPETQKITTLGRKAKGSSVNLEVDLIAKYLEKLVRHGI